MTRYSDPFVCPDCSARLPVGVVSCSSCGLLVRGPLAEELLQTLRRADDLLDRLRLESRAQAMTQPVAPYPAPRPAAPPPGAFPHSDGPRGISALSVPKILLGLGALCLLVAAVIFLAVAWSWLGVGGRTAVLVGLTLVSGGLGVWLGRRALRVAAESLTTVGLGLLALDVIGADNAGWLGDLSDEGLACAVGGTVLAAALALAVTTRLVAPQLLAVLALTCLGIGLLGVTGHATAVVALVVLGYVALAAVGGVRRLRALPIAAAVGGTGWWLGLAATGYEEAVDHASLHGLWVEGHGVALLVASAMLTLPLPFVRAHLDPARVFAAAAATMLTVTAAMPAVDENATVLGVVSLVALMAWTLVSVATPERWRPVPRVPMLVSALPLLGVAAVLAAQAAVNALGTHPPFSESAGVRLENPDPVASPVLLTLAVAALLGVAVSLLPRPRTLRWQVPAGALALAAVGTLALYDVPAWTVAAALGLLGAALLADALRQDGSFGLGQSLVGVGVALLAVPVALPSDRLTTGAAAVLVAMAVALILRGRFADQRVWGSLLLPVTIAWLLWAAAEVAGIDESQRGVPVLVAVGLLAIARPRPEIELAAALAGIAASAAAIATADSATVALAVHLTVAGVLVSASALIHPERRELGWPGGLLLAGATWVRLADIGVEAPEPYTLPCAVALLVVGLRRMRHDPEESTMRALCPGLLLATVPSLLWVLADPVSLRAALLGAACLTLALAGTLLRWNAPLLVGSAVGTLIVLRELAPYAVETPQWVLIGLAGTVLTVVGITWERRLRDLRAAAAYVGRLR